MNKKLQPLWDKLEKQRVDLFFFLEKQDPSVLNLKPAPDKWTSNQNVLHLIEAETASLAYMKKKLSFGTDLPQAGFKSSLRLLALRLLFASPFKFKAPANLAQFPDDLNLEDLKKRWSILRGEYADFLENMPDNLVMAELWRHQVVGKMTLMQMLDFFTVHVSRHRGQIEGTLTQVA